MKNKITLDNIILALFKGMVIALPLFFLPWTASRLGMDNYNKGYLLWILIPLIFFLWLGKSIKNGEFKFLKSFLNIPLFLLIGVYGLAIFFSLDPYSSLFGSYGVYTAPGLTLFSMFLLYFFITGYLHVPQIAKIIKAIILSYIILVFVFLLVFIGSWFINVDNNAIFNRFFGLLGGNFEDFAIYFSIINILITGILFNREAWRSLYKKSWQRRIIIAAFAFSFFFLLIINFPPTWRLLLIGTVFIFLINNFYLKNKFKKKINLAFYLLFMFLLILFIGINLFIIDNNSFNNRRAAKLQLDFNDSYNITRETIKKRPLFGYGPETYSYVFSLFREAKTNNTDYWYLRFNKPASGFLELAVSAGIAGVLIYFVFIFSIFYLFIIFLNYFKENKIKANENQPHESAIITAIMAALLVLIIGQFFVIINTTLLFLFWLFLSLLALIALGIKNDADSLFEANFKLIKINKIIYPRFYKILVLIIFLLISAWAALLALEIKYWAAEAYFDRGRASEENLSKAIILNPKLANYKISLAKFYKDEAIKELEKSDKDIKLIGEIANKSIDWAKLAVKQAPYSVAASEALGMTYRDISSYSKDSLPFAINAFKEARKLEPSNPVLAVELGKLYLDSDAIIEAVRTLEEAVNLKENYFEAEFSLAKAYAQSGREEEALVVLNKIAMKYSNADVFYERGKIYYNSQKYDSAIKDFEAVLSLSPNHSNALFSLGLAFGEIGDKDLALEYFNKALALNPGNSEIIKKIKDLENTK